MDEKSLLAGNKNLISEEWLIIRKRLKLKKLACLLAAALLCLGLTACNTVKGVGQDVSAVGGDIDSAATAVQNKM